MNSTENTTTEFVIQADMGEYAGFSTFEEARMFQRAHRLTGSSIIEA